MCHSPALLGAVRCRVQGAALHSARNRDVPGVVSVQQEQQAQHPFAALHAAQAGKWAECFLEREVAPL